VNLVNLACLLCTCLHWLWILLTPLSGSPLEWWEVCAAAAPQSLPQISQLGEGVGSLVSLFLFWKQQQEGGSIYRDP
jgi:hypothetical protein